MVTRSILAAAVLALAAGPGWPAARISVVDDLGTTVVIEGAPRRTVMLSPGAVEIMFAMGAGDMVVGVSEYCDYPPEVRDLPKVGDFLNPNLEAIVAAKPDIIITTGGVQRELVLRLRRVGVPNVMLYPHSVEEMLRGVAVLGAVFRREEAAARLARDLRERIAGVARRVEEIPEAARPKVYFEMSGEPLMAIGGRGYVADLISRAGGVNIMGDSAQEYPRISAEHVIRENPDVIILSSYGMASAAVPAEIVGRRPGWENLSAVKSRRVHADLDMDLFMRPGPRLVDGLEEMFRRFHPKVKAD